VASSETSLHPRPDLQNRKDLPGVAGGASSDDQVSPVFVRRREREREISENNELPFYNFYTPFLYPYVLYVSFTPVKHRAPCRRLISSLT
jgi:hypothetical protein